MSNKTSIAEQITINTSVIKTIEDQITALTAYAQTVLDRGTFRLEVILEEIPNNGNIPVVSPIFDPRTLPGAAPMIVYHLEGDETPAPPKAPVQIGYSKYFPDINNVEVIDSVGVNVQTKIGLGVIDYMIKSLKNQRATLVAQNDTLIK